MRRKPLTQIQNEVDAAYLPYRARLLHKAGYARSTIANLLGVTPKWVKRWCKNVWLDPKYRIGVERYKKSPKHRKDRLTQYHFSTYFNKKDRKLTK